MVKVEFQKQTNGAFAFRFESNDQDGLEVLDRLRVAILGEHPRQGAFTASNVFVFHALVPEESLPNAQETT